MRLVLLSPGEENFDWYQCGFLYTKNGKDRILKLSTRVNFYNHDSGKVYSLKSPLSVTIGKDVVKNDVCTSNKLICCGYDFFIDEENLEEVEELKNVFIQYVRRYNNRLKEMHPDFPSCREIKTSNIKEIMNNYFE